MIGYKAVLGPGVGNDIFTEVPTYNVVFEFRDGKRKGQRCWTGFESKRGAERYYFKPIDGVRVCDVVSIVAEGVSVFDALRLCYDALPKLLTTPKLLK